MLLLSTELINQTSLERGARDIKGPIVEKFEEPWGLTFTQFFSCVPDLLFPSNGAPKCSLFTADVGPQKAPPEWAFELTSSANPGPRFV